MNAPLFPGLRVFKKARRSFRFFARLAKAVSETAARIAAIATAPAKKRKPGPREGTRPMLLDLLDASWSLWLGGGRVIRREWYCARLGRGSEKSRERRWSTFRRTLRILGIPHETSEDEAGVRLHSPLAAYQRAQELLGEVVGEPTESEDVANESARRDPDVHQGLAIVRAFGWSGAAAIPAVRRMVMAVCE